MLGSELSEPVGQDPSEQPVAQEPVGHEPVEQPVSQEPFGEHPVGQPLGQEPSEPLGQESSEHVGEPVGQDSSEPVGQQPVGEQPVGQEQSQQPVGEPFGQEPSEHVGQQPVGEESVGHEPVGQERSEPVGQEPSEPVGEQPVGQEPGEQPLDQEPSEPVGQQPVGEEPVGQERSEPVGQERSEPVGQERSEPVGQERSEPVGQERSEHVGELVGHEPGEQPVGQEPSQQPVGQEPSDSQSKQASENPLTWSYPEVAKPEHRPTVSERLKQVAANSVSAQCGESVVRVQVNQDLLGIGRLIQPERITLGGCAATEEDAEAHVITFESELHGCGSELTMTEDVLIYTFTLVYEPKPLANTSIVKTSAAMVDIECHYLRNHDVSSNALKPTWIPNISNMVAEELLYFSLRLMTADWQFERPSNHYYLGDIINMEASVMPYHHVPLRVFVDRCVATLAPDVHTVPRYSFIEDHGCLVDAKLTGSSSQFLSRSQDDKIQFQLESFRFQPQNDSQQLYITCHLKASAASSPIDAENKACSFTDGWKAAGGDDLVCGCCDSSCAVSKARDLDNMQKEGEATLGPIMVQE
uniref:Zona pellucida sperm-binding protein 3 n=1 Tax=Oncorhynchus tshawytscha TaxID=74940 RepID=A0AAZ3RM78_ONCTS